MIRRRCSFKKIRMECCKCKSPLIINNSERDRFRSFSVIGKSEQVTTTGAQLFDISKVIDHAKVKVDGNKIIVTDAQYGTSATAPNKFSDYFPKTEIGKTYILSFSDLGKDYIYLSGVNTIWSNKSAKEITQEILDSTIVFYSLSTGKNVYSNIMLNEGSTVKPYEPYTGGKPSPSPEYPQEIKNVGKWNEEKQKYEIDVSIGGNNLLKEQFSDFKITGDVAYIPLPKDHNNHKYTMLIQKKSNKVDTVGFTCGFYNHENMSEPYKTPCLVNGKLVNENGIVVDRRGVNHWVCFKPADEKFFDIYNVMYVEGEFKTLQYQPYIEPQTLTLTSDRPITKWDKLVEQDGQIGWLYTTEEVLHINFSIKYSDDILNGETYNRFRTDINTNKNSFTFGDILSTHFTGYTSGKLPEIFFSVNSGYITFYFKESLNINTIEQANDFMKGKDIRLIFKQYGSETFIPLPQSEQDSIRSFISYSPTTIITVDGGEVDPIVEVLCAIKEMM